MKSKKEIKELEKETAKLFYKSGLVPPRRILPIILFDWMDEEFCFKVRMRTLISEKVMRQNFDVNINGEIMMRGNQKKPVIIKDNKINEDMKKLKERILYLTGINIDII